MGGCNDPDYFGLDYNTYEKLHGGDHMAVDKLAEGIKGFASDQRKLEVQLAELAAKSS
jgi:transaldolase